MIASLIFIDVNVFIYAAGAPHPYKAPCVKILSDIEIGALTGAINTEILQELLYRYTHIKLADKGIQLCRYILKYPLTILPVVENDIRLAIDLFQAHHTTSIKPRDAIHAATMRNNGITRLISADADFDRLSVIRVDPLTY